MDDDQASRQKIADDLREQDFYLEGRGHEPAKIRKLSTKWSLEAADDLRDLFGEPRVKPGDYCVYKKTGRVVHVESTSGGMGRTFTVLDIINQGLYVSVPQHELEDPLTPLEVLALAALPDG